MLEGWLETIASGQRIGTPSIVVRREVYEQLGGFDHQFATTGEDWEMWVRIATHYPVWFETEPLVLYRSRRPGSLTQGSEMSAQYVRDMRLACDVIGAYLPAYLPPRLAGECLRRARHLYASWALNHAGSLIPHYGLTAATDQLQEALRCSRAHWVVRRALWLALYGAAVQLRNAIRTHQHG